MSDFFRFFSEVFRKVPRSFSGTPGGFWGTFGNKWVWGQGGGGSGGLPNEDSYTNYRSTARQAAATGITATGLPKAPQVVTGSPV